jgi:hypothetical protein
MTAAVDVSNDLSYDLLSEISVIHELDECQEHVGIARPGELVEGACGTIFVYAPRTTALGKRCRSCLQTPVRHIRCWYCHTPVIQ